MRRLAVTQFFIAPGRGLREIQLDGPLGGAMKLGAATLLGIAFAICLGAPASSATIKILRGKDRHVVIEISGQIAPGDADVFIGAVKQANAAGKVVESVQLNSTGGIVLAGARLAEAIKVGTISTTVGRRAVGSACRLLALASG